MKALKSYYYVPAALILLLTVTCSFKVKLVGQYDSIVDESVHQIEAATTAHIENILSNKGENAGAYDSTKVFYSEIRGQIKALITRAEVLEEGLTFTPLTDNFKNLQKQYDDFELLHKIQFNKFVIEKAQEALDQSFRAIVKHLIYLKWNQEPPKS